VKTGLLLGAGFSKDFGLPLVTEVTETLKTWLTPEKYWSFENAARARGNGYSNEIAQEILSILGREEMHFEAILGHFQVQEIRSRANQKTVQTYASLYAWFARVVSEIIFGDPITRLRSLRAVSQQYQLGLRLLVEQNRPLWVFSLNYDLVVECLAATLGITIESGLPDKGSLVIRHTDGEEIARLATEVISGDQLEKTGLIFSTANHVFSSGEHEAIYLIKVHGGLDMFTIHDGKDLIKIAPIGPEAAHIIGNLVTLREQVALTKSSNPNVVFPSGEYFYKDENEHLQFLRHSIVTGAFKFDPKYRQTLPSRLLDSFQAYIRFVSDLVIIGYGFGDPHINLVIREWTEQNRDRRITIVDSYRKETPWFLLHVSPQVTVITKTGQEYFRSIAGTGSFGEVAVQERES
jgi:hypothetical protein